MTREFLLENFGSEHFKDIIYVTANPFVDMLLKGRFYRIIPVWKDGWDEELKTIHPKTVYEYALKAIGRYPGKRFIIHFMQPHFHILLLRLLTKQASRNIGKLHLRENQNGRMLPFGIWSRWEK